MSNTFKQIQAQPWQLSGAGASIGDVSITLSSMLSINGVQLTMADFGSKGFGTIEAGNGVQEEQVSWTGLTVNPNGTTTLTGVSSVLFEDPYTETPGLQKSHAGGTSLIYSNTALFYQQFLRLGEDNTVTDVITFTVSPIVPTPISSDIHAAASVEYVNNGLIAGAPDAALNVKGVTKLSVNPVSGTNPIAVGDNDGRVPTQSENDALAGTSGAPSNTNRYVTDADTSGTGAVIRNSALLSGLSSVVSQTFTADATLTGILPVYVKPYQSDGGITYQASTTDGWSGVSGARTKSGFNAGTGSNRMLIVVIAVNGANNGAVSSITYAGQTMTLKQTTGNGSDYRMYSYALLAPATGSNDLTINYTGTGSNSWAYNACVYSNVNQSLTFDNSTTTTSGSLNTSTVSNGGMAIGFGWINGFSTPGNFTNNTLTSNSGNAFVTSADTGKIFPSQALTGSFLLTYNGYGLTISLSPATTVDFRIDKTSASVASTSDTFVGFTQATINSGASGPVTINGVVSGLSGLQARGRYYLSDTAGVISTAPGTVTRKIGIALSPTTLLLTNNW
jgi:hypothetical protein